MKRWTFRILLCLLLGVVTTVGVAWGLALVLEWPGRLEDWATLGAVVDDNGTGYGGNMMITKTRLPFLLVEAGQANDLPRRVEQRFAEQFAEAGAPTWAINAIDEGVDRQLGNIGESVYLEAFGWPLLAMWSGWSEHGLFAPPEAGGAMIGYRPFTGIVVDIETHRWFAADADRRVLPLRPILPGFIINTLFYAAIWFGLFFGIGAVRRGIRRSRGRCVKCGYDLRYHHSPSGMTGPAHHSESGGTLGCPECGWGRAEEGIEA